MIITAVETKIHGVHEPLRFFRLNMEHPTRWQELTDQNVQKLGTEEGENSPDEK
jgi:hypothetical protein